MTVPAVAEQNTFTQMFQNMVMRFLPSAMVFTILALTTTAALVKMGLLVWEPAFLTYALIPNLAVLLLSAGFAVYGLWWEHRNQSAADDRQNF